MKWEQNEVKRGNPTPARANVTSWKVELVVSHSWKTASTVGERKLARRPCLKFPFFKKGCIHVPFGDCGVRRYVCAVRLWA